VSRLANDHNGAMSIAQKAVGARAWWMLALAAGAQGAVSVFLIAPAYLIVTWHDRSHLSLSRAGALATLPNLGMVVALIGWGALADHVGERRVLVSGLALTACISLACALVHGFLILAVLLFLGGLSSASANAASGRVVVGWFPTQRRGLAMGIRQIAQPVGATVAAVTVPGIAQHFGTHWALSVPFFATALVGAACFVGLRDPLRTTAPAHPDDLRNPYRTSSFLWRIHAVSSLLVVPQFTLSVFGVLWLVKDRHWSAVGAGVLIGASQLVGSAGRIGIGVWSDHVTSRVRLLRVIAVSASVVMVALALADRAHWSIAAAVFVVATTISVADNGLAFTTVAEVAGPRWAGRALGAQNTGQFVAASAVGPSMGALISAVGFPWTFVVAGALAALAVPCVPHRDVSARLTT
jgi:MFS family permease